MPQNANSSNTPWLPAHIRARIADMAGNVKPTNSAQVHAAKTAQARAKMAMLDKELAEMPGFAENVKKLTPLQRTVRDAVLPRNAALAAFKVVYAYGVTYHLVVDVKSVEVAFPDKVRVTLENRSSGTISVTDVAYLRGQRSVVRAVRNAASIAELNDMRYIASVAAEALRKAGQIRTFADANYEEPNPGALEAAQVDTSAMKAALTRREAELNLLAEQYKNNPPEKRKSRQEKAEEERVLAEQAAQEAAQEVEDVHKALRDKRYGAEGIMGYEAATAAMANGSIGNKTKALSKNTRVGLAQIKEDYLEKKAEEAMLHHDDVDQYARAEEHAALVDKVNKYWGGAKAKASPKRTSRKVTLPSGQTRCVYAGARGGEYVKLAGGFVSLRRALNVRSGRA